MPKGGGKHAKRSTGNKNSRDRAERLFGRRQNDRLALEKRFDYILIESTGIGEPIPVAQTFTYVDEQADIDLSRLTRLDCMVTVVDAFHFWQDYGTKERLRDRGLGIELDRKTIEHTLDQALLTEEEMAGDWRKLPDPFPPLQ